MVATERWIVVVSALSICLTSVHLRRRTSLKWRWLQTRAGVTESAISVSCQFMLNMIQAIATSVITETKTALTSALRIAWKP
jgi:hypothetical protein